MSNEQNRTRPTDQGSQTCRRTSNTSQQIHDSLPSYVVGSCDDRGSMANRSDMRRLAGSTNRIKCSRINQFVERPLPMPFEQRPSTRDSVRRLEHSTFGCIVERKRQFDGHLPNNPDGPIGRNVIEASTTLRGATEAVHRIGSIDDVQATSMNVPSNPRNHFVGFLQTNRNGATQSKFRESASIGVAKLIDNRGPSSIALDSSPLIRRIRHDISPYIAGQADRIRLIAGVTPIREKTATNRRFLDVVTATASRRKLGIVLTNCGLRKEAEPSELVPNTVDITMPSSYRVSPIWN